MTSELPVNEILADLGHMSYQEVADKHHTSRGTIYRVAVAHDARKNEARIQERRRERLTRQQEFLAEVMNATQKADVLDFLDGIPDASVQLHLCSPPYNVGKSYGGSVDIDRLRHHYYLGFMLQVLSEMNRTLSDGGVIALQVGQTKDDAGRLYPLDALFFEYLRDMGLSFQNRVIWELPHGLTPKRRLAERHETILIFSKGEPRHFNANAARIPQKQPDKRAFKGERKGELSGHPLGGWPTNVWRIGNVKNNHPEESGHPAQFPTELARRAVLLYTMPGDLVCDVFCGSGTVHAVCVETSRPFVGCDLFYEDLRAKRLKSVAPELVCKLPGVTDESIAVWQAEAVRVQHIPPTGATQAVLF